MEAVLVSRRTIPSPCNSLHIPSFAFWLISIRLLAEFVVVFIHGEIGAKYSLPI